MKKLNYFIYLFFISFFISFTSCNIGLGNAVDLQAPEINITSHNDNDSVAESFILRGTATDNEIVSSISIDFDDADIHFMVEPGKKWQKKTSSSENWVIVEDDDSNYCRGTAGNWNWSIEVDTNDRSATKTDTTYTLSAIVRDKIGNSGKKSKVDCSLVVDTESPSVSVYKPELFKGSYTQINTDTAEYAPKDGNVLSRLLNGEIYLEGRVEQSISFKGLNITFDNGQLQSGIRKSTSDSANPLGDLPVENILTEKLDSYGDAEFAGDASTVYFSKTLRTSDLRSWSLRVKPEEWATQANGLDSGKHLIRVVATCLSASDAWERKILGYFIWCPEADLPWFTVNACDDTDKSTGKTECYPGSTISGSCQDDDGLKTLVTKVYKQNADTSYSLIPNGTKSHLTGETVKYTAFSVPVPSETGNYKVEFYATDIYNKSASVNAETPAVIKYFKTSDVSAPKFGNDISPKENTSVIRNANGDITFSGTVTDESLKVVSLVWLNPEKASDVNNKIHYLTGNKDYWGKAESEGYVDSDGNVLFSLLKADENSSVTSYSINKKINLYTEKAKDKDDNLVNVGINGNTKKLGTQEFILFASDGESNSLKTITLTGDNITPSLAFTTIELNGLRESLVNNVPTFPRNSGNNKAKIEGTWSDDFTSGISNTTKLSKIEIVWDNKKAEADIIGNKWTCIIETPVSGGTITATLSDYAGNKRTVQSAASIETIDLGLSRIDCLNSDGAYKPGSKIDITLEFTKTTNVSGGTPTLVLNNGGIATYKDGDGTTSHVYEYIVENTDSETPALYVTKINANGAVWKDAVLSGDAETLNVKLPSEKNLSETRTITIDKTIPTISKIDVLTAPGSYKKDSSILFMMEFSEEVTITNAENLSVEFNHVNNGINAKTTDSSVSGSKYVLFTYDVKDGDNASPLTFKTLNHTDVDVIDNAGNKLTNWTPASKSFAGIIIDTTKPKVPVFVDWNPESFISDENGTSFKLSTNGETDIPEKGIEYSLDNGSNWITYTKDSTVQIKNNGTYDVLAKQTDNAGNISDNTVVKHFTIDKGELLTRITADTVNGVYSTNTTTNSITGRIIFRKEVTIPEAATVKINVGKKDASGNILVSTKDIKLEETKSSSATRKEFTFIYTIEDGDYITAADGYLDVIGLSFSSVTLNSQSVPVVLPQSGDKKFNSNRKIKIVTGKPKVVNNGVSFSGEGEAATLSVKYDRTISKSTGNIVFEYDLNAANNGFKVPVVLTASEYNELKSNEAISTNYEPGTNGVLKNGTTLSNDTSTKYILKTGVSDTNTDIVKVFTDAKKHIVTIPLISDQVTITGVNNDTLTVVLGEAYALPVKGAQYKLSIPAHAVTDEVKNVSDVYDGTVTAEGVETPQIRIIKPKYKIYNKEGNGKAELTPQNIINGSVAQKNASAYVTMSEVQNATMYINCRTPDATIMYTTATRTANGVTVKDSRPINVTLAQLNTGEAVAPTSATGTYEGAVPLGANITNYNSATGLKIAIVAQATKNRDKSELAYEYATRSVVKLSITARYRGGEDSYDKEPFGGGVKLHDYRPWLMGGDSPAGPNSIETFPLSWADTSTYQLMAGSYSSTTDMLGQWYWVSWDISSTAYIGFMVGDVPGDAVAKGPSKWIPADYHWVPMKDKYPLYPGEALIMSMENNSVAPMGADLGFGIKKKGSR